MAKVSPEAAQVNARILYWGIDGAGKRTNLRNVADKLRDDHRGEIFETPTRFDPSVSYTVLPIELGEVGGMRTRIELIAVPGGPGQAPTRMQLLDEVDGIVLVVDSQASRIEENAAILDELRKGLDDYARRLEELPLVVQYNKRDLSDAYVIEKLHRRLALGSATVFEAIATESTGLLPTLSTISKKVIRALRGESLGAHRVTPPPAARPSAPVAAARPEPVELPAVEEDAFAFAPVETPVRVSEPLDALELEHIPDDEPAARLEAAILAEASGDDLEARAEADAAQALFDQPWHRDASDLEPPLGARLGAGLSIVSVGEATRVDARSVQVPLVLGDGEGETSTLLLTLRLDPLIGESGD